MDRSGELLTVGKFALKWSLLGSSVGVLAGAASALFLWLLGICSQTFLHYPHLIFGLPIAGVAIVFVYSRFGSDVTGGNNLLLEQIHEPGNGIPIKMAPLILFTTVTTHLFGGSAGREGTAVQMGGALADLAVKPLRLSAEDRKIILMTGISAGFGAVFGTPLAGAIFGIEVRTIGRIRYDALLPCLVGSLVGDLVCRSLGIRHHAYIVNDQFAASPISLVLLVVFGLICAAASAGFVESTHFVQHAFSTLRLAKYGKPIIGGLVVIGLSFIVGNRDYNGLSLPLLERTFTTEDIPIYAFALKILFTAITLGTGFKGGEVTPLFVIGATLGHAFAQITGQPAAVFSGLGFAAVFAGAANTPIACTLMGIELFGGHLAVPLTICCVLAYLASGHRGIYVSQRTPDGRTLRDVRSAKQVDAEVPAKGTLGH